MVLRCRRRDKRFVVVVVVVVLWVEGRSGGEHHRSHIGRDAVIDGLPHAATSSGGATGGRPNYAPGGSAAAARIESEAEVVAPVGRGGLRPVRERAGVRREAPS